MCRFSIFRIFCYIMLLCLSITLCAPITFAAEAQKITMIPQTEEAVRGKKYRVAVQFHGESETLISAFRLQVTYDEQYLTLKDIEGPKGTGAAEFRNHPEKEKATAVFASLEHPISFADGVCCTLIFDVNEDAAVGSTALTATIDQLVDHNLTPITTRYTTDATITMRRLRSGNAQLYSLIPSFGNLQPVFSPEVTEYTLTVPYTVKQLTFTAEPKDGATYRVNRKNLNAAGTPTTYVVKVTSENKESVTEYVITAKREPKQGNQDATLETTASTATNPNKNKQTDTLSYGDRTIYYEGSQYAVFVLGIVVAGICGFIIVLICAKRKNKTKSNDDYRSKH